MVDEAKKTWKTKFEFILPCLKTIRKHMTSNYWIPSDDEFDEGAYSSESSHEETKVSSRFANVYLDDDDDDNVKRVVKSMQEKISEELEKGVKYTRNKMLINDWNNVTVGMILEFRTKN